MPAKRYRFQLSRTEYSLIEQHKLTSGVERGVDEDSRKDDRRPLLVDTDAIIWEFAVRVQREEVETDGGEDQGGGHARYRDARDATTTDAVDDVQREEGEDKVDDRNDKADDERVAESDALEQRRCIVQQRVPPAELLNALQAASDDQGAEVGSVEVQALPGLDERAVVAHVHLDALADNFNLELDLLFRRKGVDLAHDAERRLEVVVAEKVSRRLGQVAEHAELEELSVSRTSARAQDLAYLRTNWTHGRHGTEADHVAPTLVNILEGQVYAVRDDLSKGDSDDVEGDETTAKRGRSEFTDVKRDDEGGESDAETDDEPTDGHNPVRVRSVRNGLHD